MRFTHLLRCCRIRNPFDNSVYLTTVLPERFVRVEEDVGVMLIRRDIYTAVEVILLNQNIQSRRSIVDTKGRTTFKVTIYAFFVDDFSHKVEIVLQKLEILHMF